MPLVVGSHFWKAPTPPPSGNLLYSFGYNNYGQLGLGNTTNYSSPVQIGALTDWDKLAAGRYHSVAIKTDGTLWTWGSNTNGQLGLNTPPASYSSPNQVGSLTDWLSVSSHLFFNIAIKTDGTMWGWGRNSVGQLGLNNNYPTFYSSPTQIGGDTNWSKVSAGGDHSLAIKTNGTLWAWGLNSNGQLGDGTTITRSSPVQIGALTDWANVGASRSHSLAVKTSGKLYAWGNNYQGQLGLGNQTYYSSPVQVGLLTDWASVTAAGKTSRAIKTDGTLWTWGDNSSGQLGHTPGYNVYSPVQVGSFTWKVVASTAYQTLAIRSDYTLWAWGPNNYGQLGLGNTTNYSSPVQVGALTTWKNVANGNYHTLATHT